MATYAKHVGFKFCRLWIPFPINQAVTVVFECTHGYLSQTVCFRVLSSLTAPAVYTIIRSSSLWENIIVYSIRCIIFLSGGDTSTNSISHPIPFVFYNIWKTQLFLQQIRLVLQQIRRFAADKIFFAANQFSRKRWHRPFPHGNSWQQHRSCSQHGTSSEETDPQISWFLGPISQLDGRYQVGCWRGHRRSTFPQVKSHSHPKAWPSTLMITAQMMNVNTFTSSFQLFED